MEQAGQCLIAGSCTDDDTASFDCHCKLVSVQASVSARDRSAVHVSRHHPQHMRAPHTESQWSGDPAAVFATRCLPQRYLCARLYIGRRSSTMYLLSLACVHLGLHLCRMKSLSTCSGSWTNAHMMAHLAPTAAHMPDTQHASASSCFTTGTASKPNTPTSQCIVSAGNIKQAQLAAAMAATAVVASTAVQPLQDQP